MEIIVIVVFSRATKNWKQNTSFGEMNFPWALKGDKN